MVKLDHNIVGRHSVDCTALAIYFAALPRAKLR
jgi:hypothetical protein